MQNDNGKNILLASVISAIILISWNWLYEKPRMENFERQQKQNLEKQNLEQQQNLKTKSLTPTQDAVISNDNSSQITEKNLPEAQSAKLLSREEIITKTKNNRVAIKTPELEGSINLQGAIFDDLTLVNYKQTLDKNSKEVVLLSPKNSSEQYLANFGFNDGQEILSGEKPLNIDFPDQNTIWKSSGNELTPNNPIILSWQNKQKIVFEIKVAVDENYMFNIVQTIKNNSAVKINTKLTSTVEHFLSQTQSSSYILHEGPIGVFDGILKEQNYTNLRDKKDVDKNDFKAQIGWFGITDKYWLVAIIPDKKNSFGTQFSNQSQNPGDLYKVKSFAKSFEIEGGKSVSFEQKMFAGAKKVSLLDKYSKQYEIALFDRAIDFGWYYFLTKPFFFILQFFSKIFGNYGLAILSLPVLINLALFPLANKSYSALAKIKKLQPKIDKIREQFKSKKMQMNKEIMELYKREKVNPVSGCLPMLIQIPVFFSLYKVLYLTIDMRHAPFYGWIKDLSVPDPTSIFNLFGLLPFETHMALNIGIWPILMGITMLVQQKLNPKPSDPAQEKVMKILPIILIFVFASFPAGLLIYWTWSNILSILQQWFITKKLNK